MLRSFDINIRIEKVYDKRNTFDSMLVASGGFRSVRIRLGSTLKNLTRFRSKDFFYFSAETSSHLFPSPRIATGSSWWVTAAVQANRCSANESQSTGNHPPPLPKCTFNGLRWLIPRCVTLWYLIFSGGIGEGIIDVSFSIFNILWVQNHHSRSTGFLGPCVPLISSTSTEQKKKQQQINEQTKQK